MKITNFLITLLCITLVGCLGDESPEASGTQNPNPDNPNPISCSNQSPDVTNKVNYQIVYDECIQWDGDTGSVDIKYQSDKSELTGIGFRVHYDNLSMRFLSVSDVFSKDLIYAPTTSINDIENLDQDSSTNAFLNAACASVNGNWPGNIAQTLMVLKFEKITNGAGNYNLTYSETSVPPGYEFNPKTSLESEPEPESESSSDTSSDTNSDSETNPSSEADSGTVSNSGAGSVESPVTIPELAAATQHVYVSESTKSEDGSQETVVVTYNADAGNTGLGLRIHFDSSALSVASLDNVLAGTVVANSTPTADTDDFDGDASTDSYIDMAWASLFGGWPGTMPNPTNLATVTFDILEGAPDSTAINFSSSSNASGFTFALQSHTLVISADTVE